MNPNYPNLFSPFRIGNVILRNRMICPPSDPHYIQCSENYPSEATILHYASRARGGAALVTVEGCGLHAFPEADHHWGWDATLGSAQNGMSQLADAVHFYGSKIHGTIMCFAPPGWDVSADVPRLEVMGDLAEWPDIPSQELPREKLLEIIEQYASLAKIDKDCGFDGVYIHMAYRMVLPGRMLSPLTNHRTDEFGGSRENRMRFSLMLCKRIKELCGPDFLIEASVSAEEPYEGGLTVDDCVAFAKAARGLVDILQVRCGDVDPNHPTGFFRGKTPWLHLTESVKRAVPDMTISAVAGWFDPEEAEEALAEGKADLIAMARAFISNPEYGTLVQQGRRDELVPCIRCNKCHRSGPSEPWLSVCSVNPRWPLEQRMERLTVPPEGGRRVAVIGGGVAGMQAAEICADRGDYVTLYERSERLGGALLHAEHVDFKWPIRDYLHYHVRTVQAKERVTVRLCCEPDPAELRREDYDVIMVAVGAKQRKANIPGADAEHVQSAVAVYGREDALPENIVIVGGGEIGAETGLHLARLGHRVVILCSRDLLAPEAMRVHYYGMFLQACQRQERLSWITNSRCVAIEADAVIYRDTRDGTEHRQSAEAVLLAVGSEADVDNAMRYADCAHRFFVIGDCAGGGSIQKAVRSAWTAANSF